MRIALLGCKWTTIDLCEALAASPAVDLHLVISLPAEDAARAGVAGYMGDELLRRASQLGCETHVVASYGLSAAADHEFFAAAEIDVLLVMGWERLVPPEVLDDVRVMTCGMHGSPYGLPRGRGRSPLNWSLITDRRRFVTSLFRYDPGIDSGDVLGSRTFEINDFDTIASLHIKNRIAMQQLCEQFLPRLAQEDVHPQPQPLDEPSYFPRRRPEDSAIDWSRPTREIYNLVRAVTTPYPAAFSTLADGSRIEIVEAYPFDGDLFATSVPPGTVVDVSASTSTFVVKTVDGSLHVRQFRGVDIERVAVGTLLMSADSAAIRRAIVERYPPDVPDAQREVR